MAGREAAVPSAGCSSGTATGSSLLMTSSVLPLSKSCAPSPLLPSASDPARRGTPPPTDTAYSVSPDTVKIVEPSVLTMSGSSTPCSWSFVVENAGVLELDDAVPPTAAAAAGAGG